MAHLVAQVSTERKEQAFRKELARLHESVVDLKMKLAEAKANAKEHVANNENSSCFSNTHAHSDTSGLANAFKDRVKILSKELLSAESKNKKLLRMLEHTKKRQQREADKESTKFSTKKTDLHLKKQVGRDPLAPKDGSSKPIQQVRVLRWKPPPSASTYVKNKSNLKAPFFPQRERENEGRNRVLDESEVEEDSFAKAGTGESVLDSLPNNVLQDVLLQYWHENHEPKVKRGTGKRESAPLSKKNMHQPTSAKHAHPKPSEQFGHPDAHSESHSESKYEDASSLHGSYPDEHGVFYTAEDWAAYHALQSAEVGADYDNLYDEGDFDKIQTGAEPSDREAGTSDEFYTISEYEETGRAEVDGTGGPSYAEGYDDDYAHYDAYDVDENDENAVPVQHAPLDHSVLPCEDDIDYTISVVVDGEVHYMNDEWREWSERQHEHQPMYSVKEWFEWGANHYFGGRNEGLDESIVEEEGKDGENRENYNEETIDEKASAAEYLFSRCRNGHYEEIESYVSGGLVDVNARSSTNKSTFLIVASQSNNRKAVKALLRLQADANLLDSKGRNALYYALKFGYRSISKALIDAGSDASVDMKPRPRVVDRLLPPHLRGNKLKFLKK